MIKISILADAKSTTEKAVEPASNHEQLLQEINRKNLESAHDDFVFELGHREHISLVPMIRTASARYQK
jgi:hypothetical protein